MKFQLIKKLAVLNQHISSCTDMIKEIYGKDNKHCKELNLVSEMILAWQEAINKEIVQEELSKSKLNP